MTDIKKRLSEIMNSNFSKVSIPSPSNDNFNNFNNLNYANTEASCSSPYSNYRSTSPSSNFSIYLESNRHRNSTSKFIKTDHYNYYEESKPINAKLAAPIRNKLSEIFKKFDKIDLGNLDTKVLTGRNVTTTTFTGLNFGLRAGTTNNSYLNGKQDLSSCLNSTRILNFYRDKNHDNNYENNDEKNRDNSNSYCKKKVNSSRNSNYAFADYSHKFNINKENKVTKIKREINYITKLFTIEKKHPFSLNRPAINMDNKPECDLSGKEYFINSPTMIRKNYLVTMHTKNKKKESTNLVNLNLMKKNVELKNNNCKVQTDDIDTFKREFTKQGNNKKPSLFEIFSFKIGNKKINTA